MKKILKINEKKCLQIEKELLNYIKNDISNKM